MAKFPKNSDEKQEAIQIGLAAVDTDALSEVFVALQRTIPARMWHPQSALNPVLAAEENVEYGRYLLVHQIGEELARRSNKRKKPLEDDEQE